MLRTVLYGISAVVAIFAAQSIFNLVYYEHIPDIDENIWWGPEGGPKKNDEKIYPFKIDITSEELGDLRRRLNITRSFTPALENRQCQYGLSASVMQNITKFLKEQYDVKKRLRYINSFPHYKTKIQGLNIHFVHIKPKLEKNLKTIPILVLHGWPSSVANFFEFASLLTAKQQSVGAAFEFVIPSLPGFGYSDAPTKQGFTCPHAAAIFRTLMKRLGNDKFVIHGGDWGSVIGVQMATLYPDSVLGYHSNFCFSFRPITYIKLILGSLYPRLVVEKEHESKMYPLVSGLFRFYLYESGYMHISGTKPDTIGHGLDNSPEFLISYMVEKLTIGTTKDNAYKDDAGLSALNMEKILDAILFFYWFPKKATTAARIYAENLQFDGLMNGLHNVPVNEKVPCGCAFFENEFVYQPESFVRDKLPNLTHYETYDVGGHFAAVEIPEILADDFLLFMKKIIKYL